jgi:hypothetical protein
VVTALGMLQAKRYFEELYFQATRTHGRPGSVAFAHPSEVENLDRTGAG